MKKADTAYVLGKLMDDGGFNPTSLGKEIGLPQSTIHRILKREIREPKLGVLFVLADYFMLTLDQLTGRSPLDGVDDSKERGIELSPRQIKFLHRVSKLNDKNLDAALNNIDALVSAQNNKN
ncbi:MAG: helix-turn-helix transcriptional regulator [Pseudomonadota bacterium]